MTKRFLVMASDIQWDTWGKTVDIDLPRSVKAVVEAESETSCEEGESVPEALSRMLTEEYGFAMKAMTLIAVSRMKATMTESSRNMGSFKRI